MKLFQGHYLIRIKLI